MSSQDLLAELRSLLNRPQADMRRAIELLERSTDDAERETCARYIQDYIRQLHARPGLITRDAPEDGRLRFDPESRMLSMPDGTPLKQMCCPMEKQWSELEASGDADFSRGCVSCGKRVVNTAGLTPGEVQVLLRYDPEACLYIDAAHGNLAIRTDDMPEARTPEDRWGPTADLRVIRTARTRIEINMAAMLGDRPLVKPVTSSHGHIGSFMQVWQNRETGEISVQTDIRYPGFNGDPRDWECVLPNLNFDASQHFPEPYAAYLVPPDLEPGERVYLEDLIENFIGSTHHGSYRLDGAEAIWTGEDFDIQYDEEEDAAHYIG